MEHQVLTPADAAYPSKLSSRLGADAPGALYYAGSLSKLDRFTMAVLAADSIPASAVLEGNQLLFTLREYDMNYVGSWHSVMETEIFRLGLFRKNLTLTLFSAKGLAKESYESFLEDRFCPPLHEFPERDEYFRRATEGELLMLSVTPPDVGRTIRKNVMTRNWTACALADVVFIPFASRGTKTMTITQRVAAAGIPVFTSADTSNAALHNLGVPRFTRRTVGRFLDSLGASKAQDESRGIQRTLLPNESTPPAPSRNQAKQGVLFPHDSLS